VRLRLDHHCRSLWSERRRRFVRWRTGELRTVPAEVRLEGGRALRCRRTTLRVGRSRRTEIKLLLLLLLGGVDGARLSGGRRSREGRIRVARLLGEEGLGVGGGVLLIRLLRLTVACWKRIRLIRERERR
jgi:hypothetical protein